MQVLAGEVFCDVREVAVGAAVAVVRKEKLADFTFGAMWLCLVLVECLLKWGSLLVVEILLLKITLLLTKLSFHHLTTFVHVSMFLVGVGTRYNLKSKNKSYFFTV